MDVLVLRKGTGAVALGGTVDRAQLFLSSDSVRSSQQLEYPFLIHFTLYSSSPFSPVAGAKHLGMLNRLSQLLLLKRPAQVQGLQ